MADKHQPTPEELYDAVIVGGGPAGLTAALYLARARYRVLVIERENFGGQITITNEVVNYPGVLVTSGKELTETMRQQAEAFGAEFLFAEVTSLDLNQDIKIVTTSKGDIASLSVLLATGASPRSIGFEGEDVFKGHGVAYCATCDGEFFTGKDVFVVGGGFVAAEESVFLTKYARHVTILVREDDFTCAPAAAEAARTHEKITVLTNTEVVRAAGDDALRSLIYRNNKTGEETRYVADEGDSFGIFVFAGYKPSTELVTHMGVTNEQGYVITDEQQMTRVSGLFAAGDVCIKGLRQVATAVGEAAQAATDMERYIKAAQERVGIVPRPPVSRPDHMPKQEASRGADVSDGELFDAAMKAQLEAVFARMSAPLVLRVHPDKRALSNELEAYMRELAAQTELLRVEMVDAAHEPSELLPYVEVVRATGEPTGLAFHGVPGGHEFTSFVLGLYNAAGPGQPIDDADRAAIAAITEPVSIKVLVSLSCTMCPETVVSAQRIAADNAQVSAEVFDIAHFSHLKDQYRAMSVPCTIIERNGQERVLFGKKTLSALLEAVA
ncbi:FAD-dependent oxidoreductase [Collinsella sp. zg1085]|uniref:FAD-dependent oxidoreductase n=1 Tax=Collinsella sp. zg1085 TaxID=2844380 RepID=UPI001C0B0D21|nr:FAD-dependent oxidoreductase [Collinsella sp. zg1085]QWT17149.1 FAD-dependent oxidoreductase [Collinsella sp. zg1085]